MEKIDLTIGIPIYNGAHYLQELLGSIVVSMNDTTISYEVIVVDDGSEEDIQSIVDTFPTLPLVYVRHDTNRGTAHATNTVIEHMKGRYFLRLDADIIVNKQAIEGLFSYMETNNGVGAVVPMLVGPNGDDQSTVVFNYKEPYTWVWDYAIWLMKIVKKLVTRTRMVHRPTQIAYSGMGAIMMRDIAIEAAGTLDGDMPFFMEDADYVWRITESAWKVMYHPDYKMTHVGGHTGVLYIHMRPQSITNLHKFYAKHSPGTYNQLVLDIAILLGTSISVVALIFALPLAVVKKFRTILQRAAHSYKSVYVWYWNHWLRQ